ncbi:MAG TPA: hypothetical protein VMU81_21285 [Acetobacteraceae bacterium]|nr:hypothetical protein [Acetobacteraceae bacterium]
MSLWPLFLISLAAVGYETALTRYFAVATWSEYGYWVISIVMVGFALSGVVLALWRDALARNGTKLMAALPPLLVAAAALGFHFTTTNPFNPLQLQNPTTWQDQVWNIAGYYAALLPFFFLAGLFVSLSFVLNASRIGTVYSFDLTGAGAGAALILAAMFAVQAFFLVPLLLLPLAASTLFLPRPHRWRSVAAAAVVLLSGEALLLLHNQAQVNQFKAIYAPLHTQGARVLAQVYSPRGDYTLLHDFTERVDTDISNDAAMLGIPGPPRALGLYRDGNRIAALPDAPGAVAAYAASALDALPYTLLPHPRVLLAGASGGFRIAELLALGAAHVDAMEPEPELQRALQRGLGPSPPWRSNPRVTLSDTGPIAAVHEAVAQGRTWDIIDLSSDFLDAAEANATAFSVEAIADDLRALTPGGLVSIPVSIRDFPVYALRVMATTRAALLRAGIPDPAAHVVVYRSAWSARVLLSRDLWSPARIAALRKWCDDRSFDVSWYPGINVAAARPSIYNDLPAVSFASGEQRSGGPDDSIADEAGAVLEGVATPSEAAFNLTPVTLDRPYFYAVLRLDQVRTLLRRLEILPQAEIGALVNLAVLVQAAVIAALVLLVPLAASRRLRAGGAGLLRASLYFPALGLGFLFFEIAMIEHASFWLNDRTSGFAIVLTGMLVFSGLGSMAADRLAIAARPALAAVTLIALAWTAGVQLGLQPLMLATLDWPWIARVGLLLGVLAPLSLALGLPFPLGLSRLGESGVLPWAWGLNGAFSVVATPLANLIAREAGISRVMLAAAVLYVAALASFPAAHPVRRWARVRNAGTTT